ncbi:beta-ketoacyl-ACP synthase III [Spirillospora sp. NPDC048911]|uniref:beta-ketoacyl-ACP synthase III n=1 Tax=Spirillospora sp. NPDC048911 TaxID=3364527 RepID=UPI0037187135
MPRREPARTEPARTEAVIEGIGGCLPPRSVDNDEIAERLDTSDGWIRSRTGIARRRSVDTGTATSDLAVAAGRAALKSARVDGADLVIVATTTPDHRCPSTAPDVAARIGLGEVPAFDLNAVCSGFVYALAVAAAQIRAGAYRRVLVIGADTYTTIVDPDDRVTAPIFGDGAGAVLIRRGEPGEPGAVVATELGSAGSGREAAIVPAGGSRTPDISDDRSRFLHLNGRQTYLEAVERMSAATRAVLARAGWETADLVAFVAHQANQRILDAVGERLGVSEPHRVTNIRNLGNTAAASIPLAMVHAADRQAVTPGSRTALAAFGGGLTWGAVALTWPAADPIMLDPAGDHGPAGEPSRSTEEKEKSS